MANDCQAVGAMPAADPSVILLDLQFTKMFWKMASSMSDSFLGAFLCLFAVHAIIGRKRRGIVVAVGVR
jgi:hypothetical protein